jgi:hypothetical protein
MKKMRLTCGPHPSATGKGKRGWRARLLDSAVLGRCGAGPVHAAGAGEQAFQRLSGREGKEVSCFLFFFFFFYFFSFLIFQTHFQIKFS